MGRDKEADSQPLGQETMTPPAEPDVEMENPIDPDRAGVMLIGDDTVAGRLE